MPRGPPFLLANLNHSMRAHDLLEQARVELGGWAGRRRRAVSAGGTDALGPPTRIGRWR